MTPDDRARTALFDLLAFLVITWALYTGWIGNARMWFYLSRVCQRIATTAGLLGMRAELAYRDEVTT